MDALIVAAYAPELKYLQSLPKNSFFAIKDNVAYLSAGIGGVNASFGLTHFLEDYRPKIIIAIGTAGAFNPRTPLKTLYSVLSTHTKSFRDDVYLPQILKPSKWRSLQEIMTHPTPQPLIKDLARVYCPQEITKDLTHFKNLAQHYDLENLEMHAFSVVARHFKIPVYGILGITNHVGALAHEQWRQNEDLVAKKIARVVKIILKSYNNDK